MAHLLRYAVDDFEPTVTEDQENMITIYAVNYNVAKISGYTSYETPPRRRPSQEDKDRHDQKQWNYKNQCIKTIKNMKKGSRKQLIVSRFILNQLYDIIEQNKAQIVSEEVYKKTKGNKKRFVIVIEK